MKKKQVLRKKKVAIITNNIHCERHYQYISTIEKYFRINSWDISEDFAVDKIIIVGCGFHDGMYDKVKKLLEDLGKIRFSEKEIVISGCLPKTQESKLGKEFNGHIVELHREDLLDRLIDAEVPFEKVKQVNRFRLRDLCDFKGKVEDFFYIKISEGCLRECSFCVINKAKGYINSIPQERIIKQIKHGVEQGQRKFFLMGEDTFAYGYDKGTNIIKLVEEIISIFPGIEMYFGYLHIRWLTKYFSDILSLCKRGVFKELHIGLQHVNDEILEKMGRPAVFKELYEKIRRIKNECPGIYMIADIMVGFPGETKKMFDELVEIFKNDTCFDKVKHFGYSDVTGSTSSAFADKVPVEEIADRWEYLDEILGNRAYSDETEEGRLDNETFRKTRFVDYFICKNTFDEESEGMGILKKKEAKKSNAAWETGLEFDF